MTVETKSSETTKNETPPQADEVVTHSSEKKDKEDKAPPIAGEIQPSAPPQGETPQDPTLLGALTPQENAILSALRRRSTQLMLEVGKLEIQKDQIKDQIRANDDQSQNAMLQIGQRLGIPSEVSWTVGADGNARALPPQFMQAMNGMAAPAVPNPPAQATQTPPAQEQQEEKPKEN